MIWLFLAAMTALALAAVLWPLRRGQPAAQAGDNDVAVYRDQLEEIARDQAVGLLGAAEAEAARTEVSRRLLAAVEAAESRKRLAPVAAPRLRVIAATAALLFIPVGAVAVYLSLGTPRLVQSAESVPTAGQDASIETMTARVEAYLEKNPSDGRAWELLAPVYLRLGQYGEAVTARRRALAIFGPDATRLGDLGEALVMQSNGVVTAEAESLFRRAAAIDPEDVMAQYYLGVIDKQDGHRDEAVKRWRALLDRAAPDAPWVSLVQKALTRVDDQSAGVPRGHAAGGMDEALARLAERLKQNGADMEGWVKLVRSYRVLGRKEEAEAAAVSARAALAGSPELLARFEQGLAIAADDVKWDGSEAGAAPSASAAAAPPPGPNAQDVANAAQMQDTDRDAMIHGMVARLAERLQQDGSDIEGWLRLIRAYVVLGERDKANVAAANGRRAAAGDSAKLRRIDDLAKELGLES
jgi:cytochrome c-type biogenesis protein CcmH